MSSIRKSPIGPRAAFAQGVLVALAASTANAEEQRCQELGASCVCSEPLNTPTMVQSGAFYYNPADSVTKECRHEGGAGNPISANPVDQVEMSNAATALAALPAGHTVTHFIRQKQPPVSHNVWKVGVGNLDSWVPNLPTSRLAFRFYVYHTADFNFKNDPGSNNSKWMATTGMNSDVFGGQSTSIGTSFYDWQFQGNLFLDTVAPHDAACCWTSPGKAVATIDLRGN